MIKNIVFLCLMFVFISSCNLHNIHNNTAGHYRIGGSYTIKGITYQPKNYTHYEEVGTASWYGIEDHGTVTANGEIFNRNLISAAHKTLPLPCFVRVTNLKNGRRLIVRVNDRGPFIDGRIIDLSEKAAKVLGFHRSGLTEVKIEYLRKMSEQLIQNIPHYKKQYEREVQKYYPKKNTAESKGYVAFFQNAQTAKSAASKLRSQGIKNVRLLFKSNQYCVKVS